MSFIKTTFLIALFISSSALAKWQPLKVSAEQSKVLNSVIEQAKSTPKAVAVFDLDSTLFDNRPRLVALYNEFGSINNIHKLYKVKAEDFWGWSRISGLKKAGLNEQEINTVETSFKVFFKQNFFTSEYVIFDTALPGAAEYVQKLYNLGCTIVYLTGRGEQMRSGSIYNLERFNFPIKQKKTILLMKPKKFAANPKTDDKSKEININKVKNLGTVIAVFDNEPSHINKYAENFPQSTVVWVDTDHSPKKIKPLASLPVVQGFIAK
ncbi:hypothetical protein BVY03_00290 [bacterium K02(2017)]|nr:hypothetical protein BVY03_00290 [bacterium K02(2017)]